MVTTDNAGDIQPNTPIRKLTKKQRKALKDAILKFEKQKDKKNVGQILRRKNLDDA